MAGRLAGKKLAGELDNTVATNVGRRRMRRGREVSRRAESDQDRRDRLWAELFFWCKGEREELGEEDDEESLGIRREREGGS